MTLSLSVTDRVTCDFEKKKTSTWFEHLSSLIWVILIGSKTTGGDICIPKQHLAARGLGFLGISLFMSLCFLVTILSGCSVLATWALISPALITHTTICGNECKVYPIYGVVKQNIAKNRDSIISRGWIKCLRTMALVGTIGLEQVTYSNLP